ncbi:MAG TPA: hypothetical protein VFF76_01750 [Holophagaceae bacterium]|jgi:hypothetical protein|nr:hypothetical protein [Holophagaceae bacterium]
MNEASMPLSPAPGARSARLCGIWSIVCGVTCACLPITLVLGIIALVQQAKAKRLAKENPDHYEMPTNTGLVTGIIGLAMPVLMLPFLGIVSAIAIPAMVGQRARARDRVATEHMMRKTEDLLTQYSRLVHEKTPPEQIPGAMEAWLQEGGAKDQNPWNPASPAYDYHIKVFSDLDRDSMGEMAASEATTLGQPVFVIELPTSSHPGYLSSAIRVRSEVRANPFVNTVELP